MWRRIISIFPPARVNNPGQMNQEKESTRRRGWWYLITIRSTSSSVIWSLVRS